MGFHGLMMMWLGLMERDGFLVTLAHGEVGHGLWRPKYIHPKEKCLSWRPDITL
jgi:hypothetical protein